MAAKFQIVVITRKGREPLYAYTDPPITYWTVKAFESDAAARAFADMNFTRNTKWDVVSYEGDPVWHTRECMRFEHQQYLQVPWIDEVWYQRALGDNPICMHYLHVSINDLTKVAFTENEQKGMFDRQTAINPGRYLTRFFGGVLSSAEIANWCARFGVHFTEPVLKFATTPDEIEFVYTHGPNSCMSSQARQYADHIHPTRAYGAGDLAVAYIERDGKITARTVCWPEKKVYTRVYGDAWRLTSVLEKQGYQTSWAKQGDHRLFGARMLAIPGKSFDGYIAPYLDDGYWKVSDDGKHLIITGNPREQYENEEPDPDPEHYCDNCDDGCDETWCVHTHNGEAYWCANCTDNCAARCDSCGDYYLSDDMTTVYITRRRERMYCQDCFSEAGCVEHDGSWYTADCVENDADLKVRIAAENEPETATESTAS